METNLPQTILRRIKRVPSTMDALEKHTGAERIEIECSIERLRENRLVRISSYVRAKGTTWPVYSVGGRRDADPREVKQKPITSKASSPAFLAHCEARKKKTDDYVLQRLANGPGTFVDIAKGGFPGIRTIKESLRRLRSAGVVYSESDSLRSAYTWHLTGLKAEQKRRLLPIPSHALRSAFVGGLNPWTGASA